MRRINQPFAWIVVIALAAIVSRVVLVHHYWVPSIIRFHLADFGFPAVITAFLSTLINLFTPEQFRQKHSIGMRWTHLAIVLASTVQGLRIEYEDLVGEEQSDFDIGVLMSKWLGTPNTETFDWWDIVAISFGGLVALFLQWHSTKRIRSWKRLPLFLKG
jgi:hypothetical protein